MALIPTMGLLVGGFPDVFYDDIVSGDEAGWVANGVAPLKVNANGAVYVGYEGGGPSSDAIWSKIDELPETVTVTASGATHSASFLVAPMGGVELTDVGGFTEVTYVPLQIDATSGSLTVLDTTLNATIAAPGTTKPTKAIQVGGSDGTDLRAFLVSSTGQLHVIIDSSATIAVTEATLDATVAATGTSVPTKAQLVGGTDGTDIRAFSVTAGGALNVIDSALDGSVAGFGFAVASSGLMVAASDGTNAQPLLVDGAGNLKVNVEAGGGGGGSVWGPNASGAAPTEDPVLNAGWDGTDVRTLLTDTSGQLKVLVENSPTVAVSGSVTVVGDAANGSSVAGNPVLIGGSDGTDARTFATDSSGRQVNVGAAASGTSVTGNPVLVAGSDGTDARSLLASSTGQLHVIVDTAPTTAVTNSGLTALAASIQAIGSAIPADVVMAGASDGTDSRALLVDGSGFLKVNVAAGSSGNAAASATGSSIPADAGYTGLNKSGTLVGALADSSGYLEVNVAAFGAATLANVTTVGTITNPVTVVGNVAAGSGISGDPVQIAGSDGTDVRRITTDTLGNVSVITTMSQLLAANTNVTPSTSVSSESATAGVSGACVAVTVACTLGSTSQNPGNIVVRVRDTTTGIIGPWQSVGLLWGTQSTTLFFNIPIFKGDTVVIDIIAPAGSFTAAKNNFSAVVLGEPVAAELRPDGRGLPLGTQIAEYNIANATVITAPAAGFRLLIASVVTPGQYSTSAATIGNLTGTINGTASVLASSASGGANAVTQVAPLVWPQGILLDPATALSSVEASAATNGYTGVVLYDIVPI